jgi:hypothetical protein
MTVGVCADCGNQLISGGGSVVPGARQPLLIRVVPAHPAGLVVAEPLTLKPAPPPPLTQVKGIGKIRAQLLKRSGIKSVADFAEADPEFVARVLGTVSVENATLLIEHAKELLPPKS